MLTTNCPTCGSKVGMTNNRGTNHFIVLDNESKDQQIKDLTELVDALWKTQSGVRVHNGLPDIDDDYIDHACKSDDMYQSYQQKYPKP